MHAVDDASGPRLILMMRRYGAGVLLLSNAELFSPECLLASDFTSRVYRKPYPGLLSEESAKLAR